MYEFKLPDLGEGVHEGEVLHWHVKPGDQVAEDDPLVEVETDKAAVTIPSPKAGKVVSVNGGVGETVAVGAVLVVIEENGVSSPLESEPSQLELVQPRVETPSAPAVEVPVVQKAFEVAEVSAAPVPPQELGLGVPAQVPAPAPARRSGESVAAAPATRRRAREMGIDLQQVPGSGPGGRITTEDVLRYSAAAGLATGAAPVARAESAPTRVQGTASTSSARVGAVSVEPTPLAASSAAGIPFFEVEPLPDFGEIGPVEREPLRSIRRKVAHKMVASMTIVPHVAHMDEADVTDLDAFRREQNAKRDDGVKLTLLAFVIKAVVAQLRRWPQVNASIDPQRQEIIYKKYYNIGFAADTPKGLVVPVIAGADHMSVAEIGHNVIRLADKARAGALDVSDLKGGTFTVTNVGSLGGTNVVPTINYPEVAILGLGRAADKPVVRDGRIVVRKILPMTLSFDHRLIDGADAARFVSSLVGMLSDPGRLLVDC